MKKSPYFTAIKSFQESEEFKKLTNGDTLHLLPSQQLFLENRIRSAFKIGYDAREEIKK